MKNKLDYFKDLIEKNAYKFTKQKKLILETLLASHQHLNVDEIDLLLREHEIGIATIYRGLNQFTELGITKELNIDGTNYYELKMFGKKPLHIHFKCNSCGDLIDIDDDSLSLQYINLNHEIEDKNKLDICDTDILFKGICNKCKEKDPS